MFSEPVHVTDSAFEKTYYKQNCRLSLIFGLPGVRRAKWLPLF